MATTASEVARASDRKNWGVEVMIRMATGLIAAARYARAPRQSLQSGHKRGYKRLTNEVGPARPVRSSPLRTDLARAASLARRREGAGAARSGARRCRARADAARDGRVRRGSLGRDAARPGARRPPPER